MLPVLPSQPARRNRLDCYTGYRRRTRQRLAPVWHICFVTQPGWPSLVASNVTPNGKLLRSESYRKERTWLEKRSSFGVFRPDMSSYGEAPGQTSCVYCPRAMVGRVIGRQGETIKALQVN